MSEPPIRPEPRHGPRRSPTRTAVVARAVGGDRTAFARLIEHYQSACYGLAWRLLGDADQAADATQDAFIHAYDAIGRYRGGIFRSWLLRITANASYDILRRAQRRPTTDAAGSRGGRARSCRMRLRPNPVAEAARARAVSPPRCRPAPAAAGPADGDRAVRRLRHGLQRGGRGDQLRARNGEVADPPRTPPAAGADGRAPGTLRAMRASGPMTMRATSHPDDERLAALCRRRPRRRCRRRAARARRPLRALRAIVVDELGALRAALAELPDLAPSPPLRLLPPVDEPPVDRAPRGGWPRRLFVPAAGGRLRAGARRSASGSAAPTSMALRPAQCRRCAPSQAETVRATRSDRGVDRWPVTPPASATVRAVPAAAGIRQRVPRPRPAGERDASPPGRQRSRRQIASSRRADPRPMPAGW